jgi:nucleoside-diphosphate-sugar epimerase
MNLLITGVSSSLGLKVAELGKKRGFTISGSVRSNRLSSFHSEFVDTVVGLDLEDPRSFLNITGEFEGVIHIAAAHSGSPGALFEINGLGTRNLTETAVRLGIPKIVHVSSMSVYGDVKDEVVSANSGIRHSTPYGLSKWASECFLSEFSGKVSSLSIRSPAIIGRGASRNFLARLAENILSGSETLYVSNPQFLFNNLVHYDTLAAFLIYLADKNLTSHNSFPVASSQPLPMSELVGLVTSRLGFRGEVVWKTPETMPFAIDTKTAEQFGFKPRPVVDEVISWLEIEAERYKSQRLRLN